MESQRSDHLKSQDGGCLWQEGGAVIGREDKEGFRGRTLFLDLGDDYMYVYFVINH